MLAEVESADVQVERKEETPKINEVAELRDAVAKLAELVTAATNQLKDKEAEQAEFMDRLANQGIRKSDYEAGALADKETAAFLKLGSAGWEVELKGNWTMGLINYIKIPMRLALQTQMSEAAKQMRREQTKAGPVTSRQLGIKEAD